MVNFADTITKVNCILPKKIEQVSHEYGNKMLELLNITEKNGAKYIGKNIRIKSQPNSYHKLGGLAHVPTEQLSETLKAYYTSPSTFSVYPSKFPPCSDKEFLEALKKSVLKVVI